MLQALLMVAPSSIFYAFSIVLFHKYEGYNISVTNCMSHFYMFVLTKANVKLDHGNMGHTQAIGVFLYFLPNCPVIYPLVPVYYFLGQPYITISPGALKFYVGFQRFTTEPLEHCNF